jgi:hypothetical protein
MKFEGDIWNDKKYVVISEALREAGFEPVRADSIRSSQASAFEVIEHLRNADLVVVDITGYSSNVSYELGFCHGVGRDPLSLILICQRDQTAPFNYAHYRHHAYADLRHLRALLRYRLDISTPLIDDQVGYAYAFKKDPDVIYGDDVAKAVVGAIRAVGFTGRCEYYAGDPFVDPNLYVVGMGFKFKSRKEKATHKWWEELRKHIEDNLRQQGAKTTLDRASSERAEMRSMRTHLLLRGVAEFAEGAASRLLTPENADSWFGSIIRDELGDRE